MPIFRSLAKCTLRAIVANQKNFYSTKRPIIPFGASATRTITQQQQNVVPSMYSDVEIPNISFGEFIFEKFEKYGDRVGLINGESGETLTYAQIQKQCISLGSALARLGLSQGDVVALVSPNCPEFLAALVAPSLLGACTTTVNSSYGPEEISRQLEDSKSSMAIVHVALLQNFMEACKMYKGITRIITIGEVPDDRFFPIKKLFEDDGKGLPQNVQIDPANDILVLPYSSGTTGLPKGVMLTHRNIVANLSQILHPELCHIDYDHQPHQETFIGVLPMYHSYGMTTCLFANLCIGGRMVTMLKFTPQTFVEMLKKYQPTIVHTVPPILNMLVQSAPPQLLQSAHTIMCGAAPVGPTLMEQFSQKFTWDVQLQEGYGMTEASPVTHMTPKNSIVPGSCGKSVPNTLAKIVDVATREVLNIEGSSGELWVKGPQIMKGYLNNQEATNETISDDGWLCTGDVAKIDAENNVYIIDRIKELIKVKGLQVPPAELEDLLRQHPDVADVAVIGVPDERTGEAPKAFIVPTKNAKTDEEQIQKFVEGKVAPHKKLSGGVVFVESIPKSPTGKILRRELQ